MSDVRIAAILDHSLLSLGLNETVADVKSATSQMQVHFNEVASTAELSGRRMSSAMRQSGTEARGSLALLGEEAGLKMPRHIRNFVAALGPVQGALSAAFIPLAIVGMIAVLKNAGDELGKFIADTFIYTDAEKAKLAAIVASNRVLAEHAQKIKDLAAAYSTIGQSGSRKLETETGDLADKMLKLRLQSNDVLNSLYWLRLENKAGSEEAGRYAEKLALITSNMALLQQQIDNSAKEADASKKEEGISAAQGAAEAEKRVWDARIQLAESYLKAKKELEGISARDELAALENIEELKYEAEKRSLQKRLSLTGAELQDHPEQVASYRTLQGQLEALEYQHAARMKDISTTAQKASNAESNALAVANQISLSHHLEGLQQSVFAAGTKASLNALRINNEFAQAELDYKAALAEQEYQLRREEAERDVAEGRISRTQALAIEKKYLDDAYQALVIATRRKLAFLNQNDPDYPLQKQKLEQQIAIADRKRHQTEEQLERQHEGRMVQIIKGWQQAMASGFQTAIDGMIRGTQSLAQGFSEILLSMLDVLVGTLGQMLAQWITTYIIMKIFGQATTQATAQSQISAAAAVAGANGVASMAGAPFPIDLTAPVFGAAMFTAANLYRVFRFAKGGLVPGFGNGDTVPAFLTPGEMVLPKELSRAVVNMAHEGGDGFGGGRGAHMTYAPKIAALDGKSVGRVLRSNNKEVMREFKRLTRGGVRFRLA
ncbi:MAG: hypothetical protein M3P27_02885 [Acidobacteriota bacterium]|nr:hypothetical protein [Acidobacteriota bacterium]